LFSQWSKALADTIESGQAAVLVTQIADRGSSPRSRGTKMVVTLDKVVESLGGGNLEYDAVGYARELIHQGVDGVFEKPYTLNSSLGQCCGGEVRVLFEGFNASLVQLYLFGAGHVAQALVPILAGLGFNVHWIDDRDELFTHAIPPGVNRVERDPIDVAGSLPKRAWSLIMTHDHQLDFDLVLAALSCEFDYLGMIGSNTKARRFMQRLDQRGIAQSEKDRIDTPIGLPDLKTKTPTEIAVSIAADLMYKRQKLCSDDSIESASDSKLAIVRPLKTDSGAR